MEYDVATLFRAEEGTVEPVELSVATLDLDGAEAENVKVVGQLIAIDDNVQLTGSVSSMVKIACSRCLELFPYEAAAELNEAFSHQPDNEQWPIDQDKIDLEPAVSAALTLAIPAQPLHEPTCQGLCSVCGKNLNTDPHQHDQASEDHPFAELNKLKDDAANGSGSSDR